MSNEIPAILLMFANQDDAYLDKLKEESKSINSILGVQEDKGNIKVFREESATIADVNDALLRFESRAAIFHYAGHADGNSLHFEKGEGNANGIAELLGQLPNLKLVFLNGCSTQGQVEYLMETGVKAVIATAVPINDEKAVVFAENFYRALANYHHIESAFLRTVSLMKTIYGGDFDATVVRRGQTAFFDNKEEMPWGLYVNENADAALNWEIPTQMAPVQEPKTEAANFIVNQELQEVIKTLIDLNPALEQLCMLDGEIDSRAALLQIIQNYPWPIATQIRLLVAKDGEMDTASLKRIKQIVSVYINTTKFLFYTAVSQLWHEKQNNTLATKSYLVDMLHIGEKEHGQFDYFRHFLEIIRLLKANNIEPFAPEFLELLDSFDSNADLYEAYGYMESLRTTIYSNNTAELEANLTQKAGDGEYHLSTLLIEIAFLVKYRLITIRDIHVINPKYMDIQFNHFMRRLNVSVGNIAVSGDASKLRSRSFSEFTNNASVILTSDIQDPSSYLNLSPFIIDVNSFKEGMTEDRATEQQLFMYAHRAGEGSPKDYKYYSTFHNIYVAQERSTDQFIVKGSSGDSAASNSGKVGRSSRRRTRRRATTTAALVVNPYEVLKKQFEILEKDLIR